VPRQRSGRREKLQVGGERQPLDSYDHRRRHSARSPHADRIPPPRRSTGGRRRIDTAALAIIRSATARHYDPRRVLFRQQRVDAVGAAPRSRRPKSSSWHAAHDTRRSSNLGWRAGGIAGDSPGSTDCAGGTRCDISLIAGRTVVVTAAFLASIGYGLWRRQNWARIVTIVLTAWALASALFSAPRLDISTQTTWLVWAGLCACVLCYLFTPAVRTAFRSTVTP
jgi:hypothetical protein